ncbi:MAG: transposase [Myxococcota bacterium]|nr:transposase [Myxococcota bacterium]
MPRIPRAATGSNILHIINRGNARATVFHSDSDYAGCINLLSKALDRFELELYAFTLMPNHFHLVVHPQTPTQLSEFMQWWLTAQVRRHHSLRQTSGHVWQGRFKSFPIQQDEHLLTVLRYVLLNPVRAGLVREAQAWRWSSLRFPRFTTRWPVRYAGSLESWLADPLAAEELDRLRTSVARKAPFGDPQWQRTVAGAAGLATSLRPLGRPKHGPRHLEEQSPLPEM